MRLVLWMEVVTGLRTEMGECLFGCICKPYMQMFVLVSYNHWQNIL